MKSQNKNNQTLELIKRMVAVRESKVFSSNYTAEYLERYPRDKNKIDIIRNVWNCKGLISHIDILEKFERIAENLKHA